MGRRSLHKAVRSSVARLSAGDRAAPHAGEKERNGRTTHASARAASLPVGVRRSGSVVGANVSGPRCASPREAERMRIAWTKAVILSITLWSAPYEKDGL